MKRVRLIFADIIPEFPSTQFPFILKKEIVGRELLLTIKDFDPDHVNQLKSLNPENIEVHDLTLDDIFVALEG